MQGWLPWLMESIEFEEDQKALLAHATVSSPVDMVCAPSHCPYLAWMSPCILATKEVQGER